MLRDIGTQLSRLIGTLNEVEYIFNGDPTIGFCFEQIYNHLLNNLPDDGQGDGRRIDLKNGAKVSKNTPAEHKPLRSNNHTRNSPSRETRFATVKTSVLICSALFFIERKFDGKLKQSAVNKISAHKCCVIIIASYDRF